MLLRLRQHFYLKCLCVLQEKIVSKEINSYFTKIGWKRYYLYASHPQKVDSK